MFDYSKYENATPKQILNALTLAEKRAQRLEFQVKENKAFFNFLQKKLKSSFSTKKKLKYDEPTEETKAILAKDEPTSYTNFDKLLEAVDEEIKAENA